MLLAPVAARGAGSAFCGCWSDLASSSCSGENDGPSMLSYAATGAKFGIGFFIPFIILTFAMAIVVQEMTVRLAAATQRGHAELIFERFGPFWGWFSLIDLAIGNFLTLITEFIAVRAGLGFFGVPAWAAMLIGLAVLFAALLSHRYWTWERITLTAAACNLIFIPIALMSHPDWHAVTHSLVTWSPLPGGFDKDTLLIVLADIGATVTPWMLFFQQSAVVDKGMTKRDLAFRTFRHHPWSGTRRGCRDRNGTHNDASLHAPHVGRKLPGGRVRTGPAAHHWTLRRRRCSLSAS